MKNATQTSSRRLLQALTVQGSLIAAVLFVAGAATTAYAQTTTIVKANSATSLTTPSDWQGGVVPGPNNIAQWDSTVTGADTEGLGANTNWAGITILNPGGPVTISNDGFTNTLGTAGIVGLNGVDMSSATANLTMNENVVLNGVQNWNVGSGRTLALGGTLSATSGSAARFYLASGASVTITNATGTLLGPTNGGAAGGNVYATLNDTDFVGVASGQIVGGSTLGVYTANPSANPPSISGTINGVIDCVNAGAGTYGGVRASSTLTIWGLRFNETNALFGNWQVNIPSGRNFTVGSILVTTNVGNNPIYIGQASGANLVTIPGTTGSLMLYQDNPGAPLYFGPAGDLTIRQGSAGGTADSLVKMGAGTVIIQCNSTYTGGTKVYEGTLQIDGASGNVGTSALSVYGGNFEQSGASINSAATTVSSGASYSVYTYAAGAKSLANANVTLNSGTTLQFIYSNTIVPSATIAPLYITNTGTSLSLTSPVNVSVSCGGLSTGVFPLVTYTGALGGTGYSALSTLTLPPHIYGYLSNDTANSSIDLVVTNVDQPLTWNTGSGTWDIGVTSDWLDALNNSTTYQQVGSLGDNVLFNDSGTGPSITVTLNTNVIPSSVTFNDTANSYTLSGTGSVRGVGSLTKSGSGTVTLSTTNTFAGGINLNGGTTVFSTIGNLGSGNINFNGGTLQYNGNTDDISTRTVTIGSGGATINTAGSSVTFSNTIGNAGTGGLTKAGAGTLTLVTNAFTYNGNTVVSQGTLTLGAGATLTNSPAIIVNGGAILDSSASGLALSSKVGVNQILAGTGQVNGLVTVPASTTISPATNGVIGSLAINGGLTVSGGTLAMDVGSSTHDLIAVTGNLALNSGFVNINATGTLPFGRYILATYTGGLIGNAGNLVPLGFNQAGAAATLDTSVAGQLALVVGVSANDNIVWNGSFAAWDTAGDLDWYLSGTSTSWAYTNGDTVNFNDSNGGIVNVQLTSSVVPHAVIVSNTVVPVYTIVASGGSIQGAATLSKDGTGTLIVNTPNSYSGSTTIKNGTLQIGSGAAGDIGQGNVTNNGALVFEQGDGLTHFVDGSISGTGSVTVSATNSTIVLATNNTYSGPTTISAGTLQVGNGAAGSLGSNTSVTDNGALTLNFTNTTTFGGNVSGTGSFGTVGSGIITLAGTLTYQGTTEVSNGVIKVTSNNQLPNANSVAGSTGSLNVDGGLITPSILDMNGFSETVNGLSGAANTFVGIITNSSTSTTTTNVLTVLDLLNVTNTYNGQIQDHGATGARTALFVTGPGTLVLNPLTNNLFSGGMTISNSTVWIGAPGSAATANVFESTNAPGLGPITALGTNVNLYLNGGQPGASTTPTYFPGTQNPLIVPAGATLTIWACNRGDYFGSLTGSGTVDWVDQYVRGGNAGNWSAFTGQIIMQGNNNFSPGNVGNVGFGNTNGLPNATVTMITNVQFHAGSLSSTTAATWPTNAAGVLIPFQIGALQGGDDTVQLEGAATAGNANGVNLAFAIGGLNTSTTYGGGLVDPISIIKVGTGTLSLNDGGVTTTNVFTESDGFTMATNIGLQTLDMTYTGNTTVSNGVLKLCAPVEITNSAVVTIASAGATLDASSMGYETNIIDLTDSTTNAVLITNSVFEVITNTLGGIGTLNGFLLADQTSTLTPGLPTGTFNVTSNATLSGLVRIDLDATNTQTSGELAAPGITVNPTATLVVTNVGPGLFNGTTYTLFNHPVSGFASMTLPATDPTGTTNYIWQNQLAVNGTITLTNGGLVVVPVNPNPTNIVFSASAGSLTLSWPSDHTGWTLQSQTNAPGVGITATWYNVAGSSATDQLVVPFIPTDSVFYRLVFTNTP